MKGHGFIQYWIVSYLWYKEKEGPITIVYGIKTVVWRAFSSMTIKQPKLAQVDKV
jgi:hypothetical protein